MGSHYGEGYLPRLADAVRSGNLREQLLALRDYLAARLDDYPPARDAAPLAQRLQDVLIALDGIPDDSAEVSAVVDLTARIGAKLGRLPASAA
jgi:hypothetical protein